MSSEPKNKLSVSVWYKSRMLKWGILVIIGGMTIAGIFFQGYSNGTKKYQDLVAELRQQISEMEQKMEEEPIIWHGGDPSSIEFCHEIGLDYVSCSPYRVPIARLSAAQANIKNKRA